VAIRFLLRELENVKGKIQKLLRVIDSDSAGTGEAGRDRQMLGYHAMQTRVIWSLMRSTRNEILSIFEHYAENHVRSDLESAGARDVHRPDCIFVGEEVEVLSELSKRWNIWRRQYESEGFASPPLRENPVCGQAFNLPTLECQ
jgi:hypothetical protein